MHILRDMAIFVIFATISKNRKLIPVSVYPLPPPGGGWQPNPRGYSFGAGVTNLNEPPSSFLLFPRRCGLGADSIPLRAIVNKKQCETRVLFMSLVIHY